MDLYDTGVLDPAAERSRATMWDVPRFAEYHNYRIIIVENVVDARKWVMFDAWLMAMHALGYNHRCTYLNSMHFHPTPQSRDRMYVVFWKKGNKAPVLDYTPLAYCSKCSQTVSAVQTWKKHDVQYGKYRQQYVYCCSTCTSIIEPFYYAAFNCIDWTDIGSRIGDRKKPLSEKTVKRINYGLKKYGKEPFLFHQAYSDQARGIWRSLSDPTFSQTTVESQAMITPFIIKCEHSHHLTNCKAVSDSLSTHTTRQSMAMIAPPVMVIAKGQSMAKPLTDAMSCQTSMINLCKS
jgi:DNA (cytosine-5)-methyltransferase 1